MALSFIDSESFVTLRNPAGDRGGAPEIPFQDTEVIVTPGVDSQSVRLLGVHGHPFVMVSGVDVDDMDAAQDKKAAYADLSGEIVTLTWNGVDYLAQHGCQYIVLAVSVTAIRRLARAVGGISSAKLYWVEAAWQLIPVNVS